MNAIRIPGWLITVVLIALALLFISGHTTLGEFVWFIVGTLAGIIGMCVLAMWFTVQKRNERGSGGS